MAETDFGSQFGYTPSLDELMADVSPLSDDEDFAIADLTAGEWEAFAEALHE